MAEGHSTSGNAARPVQYRTLSQYPGYRFGSDGSVWSCRCRWRRTPWRRLKLGRSYSGDSKANYLMVIICVDGQQYTRKVHRLILEAFVGPRPEGMVCCHADGDATNNRIENLRWDTSKSNAADMRRHGTMCRGEKSPGARITEEDVLEIRRLYVQEGMYARQIGKMFGMNGIHVLDILHGKRWAHVPISKEERLQIEATAQSNNHGNRKKTQPGE